MNRLSLSRRAQVLRILCEGVSIRATTRITGVSKAAVTNLLVQTGKACRAYHDEHVQQVRARKVQCDEIWTFVGCKEKNVRPDVERWSGDAWTWVGIDAETKLALSWMVGTRSPEWAGYFMRDLASRVVVDPRRRLQLTTDGHSAYLTAVENAFGWGKIDYAMLVKEYGCYIETSNHERRYSPSTCTGAEKRPIMGNPDPAHISTSHMERCNLTIRMQQRRFTRLTNAFSKRVENLRHAVSLHFMFYNYVRRHQTIRTTPAFRAGLTDRVWTTADLAELVERYDYVKLAA